MTTATDPGFGPPRTSLAAKLGAAAYLVWALLHLQAAWGVYRLGLQSAPSIIQGRLFQDAWNLACFSAAAIGVALILNWRNDRWGYWLNLAVIGVADIGFIIFVLLPGYVPPWPGVVGPVIWLVGLALTTIGLAQGR